MITSKHIHQWLDAWNSHQVDQILRLCSEDIVLHHPQYAGPLRKAEISICLEDLFLVYPQVHIETDGFLIDGHEVASWEMITGIISNTSTDKESSKLAVASMKKASSIAAAMRLVYNGDGLIKSIRIYWDTAQITQPVKPYPNQSVE